MGNGHWCSQDFVLRVPENRGAVGAERETPKASSGKGNGEGDPPPKPTRWSGERRKLRPGPRWTPRSPGRKQILVHFELEKTNLVTTNSILFVIFIAHIYSQIYKASFDIFSHSMGG